MCCEVRKVLFYAIDLIAVSVDRIHKAIQEASLSLEKQYPGVLDRLHN